MRAIIGLLVVMVVAFPWRLQAQLSSEGEELALMEKYGKDYILYRQGRETQAVGEYAEARGYYLQLGGEVLADAGKAYAIECQLAEGSFRDAVRGAKSFLVGNPSGYYTFDAQHLLAMAQYLDGSGSAEGIAAARATLAQALASYDMIYKQWEEEHQREQNLPALLLLLKDENPIDKAIGDFGVSSAFALPGSKGWPKAPAIFNRRSCSWYLPWTKCRLHLLEAFLAMEGGDEAGARKALDAAGAVLPMHDPAVDAYRQRFNEALRRGAFFHDAAMWGRWQRHSATLRLTGLLVAMGENNLASGLALTVLRSPRATREESASAVLACLLCHLRAQRPGDARALLDEHGEMLARANLLDTARHLAQLSW